MFIGICKFYEKIELSQKVILYDCTYCKTGIQWSETETYIFTVQDTEYVAAITFLNYRYCKVTIQVQYIKITYTIVEHDMSCLWQIISVFPCLSIKIKNTLSLCLVRRMITALLITSHVLAKKKSVYFTFFYSV